MEAQTVKRPGFFKFFLPERHIKQLLIPSTFMRSIEGSYPENVVLRDRYDNLWQVKVVKAGDAWYFKDGWTKFVKDNLLNGGEMLVYEYMSEGVFLFKIIGLSGCLVKGVGGRMCKNSEKHIRTIEEVSSDDETDDKDDGNDYVPVTGQDMQMIDEDETDEDDEDFVPVIRKGIQLNGDPGKQVRKGGTATRANPRTAITANPHQNKRTSDWFGAEIFRFGRQPLPMNPYFVTRIQKRNFALYVPGEIIKEHNLELPKFIKLVDQNGREFSAVRRTWADGRVFYSKAWSRVCKMNVAVKEDKCICEFMRRGSGELYISVRFVRANSGIWGTAHQR